MMKSRAADREFRGPGPEPLVRSLGMLEGQQVQVRQTRGDDTRRVGTPPSIDAALAWFLRGGRGGSVVEMVVRTFRDVPDAQWRTVHMMYTVCKQDIWCTCVPQHYRQCTGADHNEMPLTLSKLSSSVKGTPHCLLPVPIRLLCLWPCLTVWGPLPLHMSVTCPPTCELAAPRS